MFAVDTSTFIAHLNGYNDEDVQVLRSGLQQRSAVIPPMVLTEILCFPLIEEAMEQDLIKITDEDILPGFWLRAATTRKKVLSRKLKARLADTLITQFCLDHDLPLLTRDKDFRHFKKHAGLELVNY